ncbi:hypothetical protein [Nesterenkonia ebinurensis]|uniref:hypothetical protein n=1 Tax=Nesterenkonia ebinurensis TaxID=2608252 RepID=UPI00168B8DAC|nr:hypothetical protein [Nesterenkonia ebinurensis]
MGADLRLECLRDIVRGLTQNREVALALIELRLESSRRPEIAMLIADWRHRAFTADVAFNAAAGLPGGPEEIALFHYAIDGLILDRLTTPLMPESTTDEAIDALVAGLLPSSRDSCVDKGKR